MTFYFKLPADLLYVNYFVADSNFTWSATTVGGDSRRGEWIFAALTVPPDCAECDDCAGCMVPPIQQLGFQIAIPAGTSGSFLVDEISW